MKVLMITPPVVQLNSPYPSGAYLSSFFKQQGENVLWKDLNISLFHKIFSRQGLTKLFELSEQKALQMAQNAQSQNDFATAFNLRRYVATKEQWIQWIDFITSILCGKMREKEHDFLFSPFAPRGARMENFLSSLNREPSVDDVRFLCSYALADLADYITAVFDNDFSLIRYAEHLSVDKKNFSQIEQKLNSPVLSVFYEEVLQENLIFDDKDVPDLVCISIPFAGTFLPSLYTARFLKNHYNNKVFIAFGGGFVNTELRQVSEKKLSKYINAFSFDRGYGSYIDLKNHWQELQTILRAPTTPQDSIDSSTPTVSQDSVVSTTTQQSSIELQPLYKMQIFFDNQIIKPLIQHSDLQQTENSLTSQIFPDFSDIDFSVYPRVCDDMNAMHRIWNDGSWIKAYLAHGCYWHKCAFCDTQLDYVCGYKIVDTEKLFYSLLQTASEKNIFGIHFVDEALPPKSLKQFALLNAQNGGKLYFWGNVRFEKTFTKDFAAFLSYCGFGGASAGLEVATSAGLKSINKGTDIFSVVSSCAAFKEAGILVHAYMIYGFWNDTPQTIINSMETLRQFFQAGLLDSAFWHKFVLTKNSQVFSEWKKGLHPDLFPLEPPENKSIFANNNLHFKGEDKFDKYSVPLENALASWMHNEHLQTKIQKWFDFPVPNPQISKDYVENLIQKYIENSSKLDFSTDKDIFWLGSDLIITKNKNSSQASWFYLQEEYTITDKNFIKFAPQINDLLKKLSPQTKTPEHQKAVSIVQKSPELQTQLKKLHSKGLVVF